LGSRLPFLREKLKALTPPGNLQFSFAIGQSALRFYKGPPDDPPERYIAQTFDELRHRQFVLAIDGLAPIDTILRLAVEPDVTREVGTVTLVEMNEDGRPTNGYVVPFDIARGQVLTFETKPAQLPPPRVEPIANEEEEKKKKPDDEQNTGSK
jgi:hypothetical protein